MACLNGLGRIAHRSGDFVEARKRHKESLELSRAMGDSFRTAVASGYLGFVAYTQVCLDEAKAYFADCLTHLLPHIDDALLSRVKAGLTHGTVDELRNLVDETMTQLGNVFG